MWILISPRVSCKTRKKNREKRTGKKKWACEREKKRKIYDFVIYGALGGGGTSGVFSAKSSNLSDFDNRFLSF